MSKENYLPRRKKQIISSAYYPGSQTPHPLIRLAGKYLLSGGFKAGDTVEVVLELGRIEITKIPEREKANA